MSDPSHGSDLLLTSAEFTLSGGQRDDDSLQISELRYRRLFEAARDGILILDIDFGRITDANPFMSELLGYSYEELIGKELWEIGLLQDKKAAKQAFRQLMRDGYIRYEDLPLENRNGQRWDVEFVCNLYRENGHMVIQCNIRDITERKRAEAILAGAAMRNERIVEMLQRSMLHTPATGKFAGLAIETRYDAALNEAEVGGDFFDFFALEGNKVAIIVGDVSGKGLAAAERTSEVKYVMRAYLHCFAAPEQSLAQLNKFICETHAHDPRASETFIVLAVAIVDTDTGATQFLSAGAEASLILRADGTVELIEMHGMPLGIEPVVEYIVRDTTLQPLDTLIMATDGITEARHGGSFLGVDGLAHLARSVGPAGTLSFLCQAIYSGALTFAHGKLRDDVCVVAARRK
jgi:PAS domain S-box-containing protein